MDNYKIILGKFGDRILKDEPLAKHTYFKIGGPAKYFFEPQTNDDFVKVVQLCLKNNLKFLIIGNGANTIFADGGFDGLVIKNRVEKITLVGAKGTLEKGKRTGEVFVKATSGTLTSRLSRYTIEEGLKGFEMFVTVPGTIGGALKINAHFRPYMNEFVGNAIAEATLVDKNGELKKVNRDYFEFGYDISKLQQTGEIVADATFKLEGGFDPQMLWQTANQTVLYRNSNQPVGMPCSGCIFRNIDESLAKEKGLPTTSAGYLIDQAGLKGTKIGGVQISDKHANYFLNTGNASSKDVGELVKLVKEKVMGKFGIDLKPEVFLEGV
ncbi:MAG TPA: UDP-N-acetylmuramate dehydrogenase [Patescibacteria group bacterium]